MSDTNSKLPNLENLKLLNDLLEELECLKKTIQKTKQDNQDLAQRLELEEVDFVQKAENEAKKRITLEFIENKILELRAKESQTKQEIEKVATQAIEKYLSSGAFKQFLTKVIADLKNEKQKFVIFASQQNSHYLPESASFEEVVDQDVLRIETPEKIYIFDLDTLKSDLRKNLVKTKLPAV